MNRDDIIRMAREAGYSDSQDWSVIVRFANLVAAAEREKVAAWMIQFGFATGHGDTTEDLLKELEWQIAECVTAERNRCAQICDHVAANAVLGTAGECARAIRNATNQQEDTKTLDT